MDTKEFRITVLMKEIDLCSTKVNHFDTLRLTTRQTGLALWAAVIGYGLTEKFLGLFVFAALLPIPFWTLDARYRSYQRGWSLRLQAIRDFIRDGDYEVGGQQVATLADFLHGDQSPVFPVIDYWAERTVPPDKHRAQTDFWINFVDRTHLMLYSPMCVIAIILSFWWA